MPIQTTPTTEQAVDYLTATIDIPAREMSRPMYQLINSCARVVQRTYPGMSGYYNPEYSGPRVDLSKRLHFPARVTDVIPQSPRLLKLTEKKYPSPWDNSKELFGI